MSIELIAGRKDQMEKLTFTELVELMLARTYELAEEHGHGGYRVDLMAVGKELGADLESSRQATQALEERGLINCLRAIGGFCNGHISASGRLFVENGGKTGVIGRYHQDRSAFIYVSNSPGANVNAGNIGSSQVSNVAVADDANILRQVRETLMRDASLKPAERQDALAEVQIVEAQLAKSKPNKGALRDSLDTLGRISSVGSFVVKLSEKLF
ncbi:hypothetical protein [Corallococcus macrosporus]|uniref:hypothetical protein n=1 Tax=Corallococcus macrosporus TaxID=35 RepID=UPI000F503F35|nr:hypothetical protein [Corallococcus macrosporus]